jgi:hypothetical protein
MKIQTCVTCLKINNILEIKIKKQDKENNIKDIVMAAVYIYFFFAGYVATVYTTYTTDMWN